MSNGIIIKALLNHKLYTKSAFQGLRSPARSLSSGSPSPQPRSRSISPIHPASSTVDLSFVPVKLQLPSTIPKVTEADATQVTKPAATTRGKKVRMSVKIRMFKGLQNGIENPKEFLEELNWIYKREHKADESADDTEKAEYISETRRILFRSNLEGKAELWYSKLPPAIKENWEALKKEFLDSFGMEEVDRETRLVYVSSPGIIELKTGRNREHCGVHCKSGRPIEGAGWIPNGCGYGHYPRHERSSIQRAVVV